MYPDSSYHTCPDCNKYVDHKLLPMTKITRNHRSWYVKIARCPHCHNFLEVTSCSPSGCIIQRPYAENLVLVKQNEFNDTILWNENKKNYDQVRWNGHCYALVVPS